MLNNSDAGTLSEKALAKVSGPGWVAIRNAFIRISDSLLSASPKTYGDLTTIYVKYMLSQSQNSPVYGVVWLKNVNRLTVGLALPNELLSDRFITLPQGMFYRGITKYFVVEKDEELPADLDQWSIMAYQHVSNRTEQSQ